MSELLPEDDAPALFAGLCGRCAHVRKITSQRGSTFWLCGMSEHDARFSKYPPLPTISCPGFENRVMQVSLKKN